jgi:beta-glucosidase
MRKHLSTCAVLSLLVLSVIPALAQAPARAKEQTDMPSSQALASADIERRVDSILGQMTLEEKVDLIGGVDGFYIRDVPRLGVPRLKMTDGPIGVRNYGPATVMAGGISLAATWNPALAQRVGAQIARDARAKGVHFLLGPGVNIYRAPMNGRNFEYFGEDPFLASRIAVGYIEGVQSQGVSATIKHFMGNNSEFLRHDSDSIIGERAMREIYLPVFEAAVKEAHVGAIMDSYNLTNGQHMTQNGYLNTDVVKNDWGFRGIIMSDWDATYDGVAAANGGLDLEMPSGKFMNRAALLPAIQEGKVSVDTIDDKVRRILRTAIEFGWFDREQTDFSIPRYSEQGREAALQAAREGMVLLKNDGNLLPLAKTKIKSIAVIGPDAYPAQPVGGGSAQARPFAALSFLEGLSNYFGTKIPTYYARGVPALGDLAQATEFSTAATNGQPGLRVEVFDNADLSGTPVATHIDRHVNLPGGFAPADYTSGSVDFSSFSTPKLTSARWSGYYTPEAAGTYSVIVQGGGERGGYRLYLDDMLVVDAWQVAKQLVSEISVSLTAAPHKILLEQYRTRSFGLPRLRLAIARQGSLVEPDARAMAAKADVVVVAAGFDPDTESEGSDRTFQLPPGQDELIREMAAVNKNTIVVVTSGGSVDMNGWLDRVPALIEAWFPGQEGGTALAEILFGDVNPAGRLPVTFERRWEDNPVHDSYYLEPGSNRVVYKEGIFVGYRGYEHNDTKPLFPFGYGLSYTSFKYGNLAVTPASTANGNVSVSFDVTNTGAREGADVAQVYVRNKHAKVPVPPKELKGFQKVSLRPGETRRVTVALNRRSLSYYDTEAKQWRADPGDFEVLVGRSSEQIELHATLTLTAAPASASK